MRLIDWILRRRRDEDLDAELRAHVSLATQDRMAHGEDARTARLAALKEFGNVTLTREATRRSWGGAWREHLADLLQDVRYSVRVLSHSPGYALVVIAVLALGIGANVSTFRLLKAVGLEPLPAVKGSASFGVLVARNGAGRIVPLSHPDFRDIRKEQRAFDGLAGAMMDAFSLGLRTQVERCFGDVVTGNCLSVLGVRASLGRTLHESDDVTPGQHPVVVISDALWKRAFASDPGIVGKTVQINAYAFTVVGVAEPGFQGSVVGVRLDVFMPLMMQPQLRGVDLLASRQSPMVWGIGHLRRDSSFRGASEEATTLSRRIDAQQPAREVEQHATVIPM